MNIHILPDMRSFQMKSSLTFHSLQNPDYRFNQKVWVNSGGYDFVLILFLINPPVKTNIG